MYPALVKAFGSDFNFAVIKERFDNDVDGRRALTEYTEKMTRVLDRVDEEMKNDIVALCLCVAAIDGKISLKERRYVKRLCKA